MGFNINVTINNSFNNRDDSHKKDENKFKEQSTLNTQKNLFTVVSESISSSFTSNQEFDNTIIPDSQSPRRSFLRDTIIGAIGSALGAIVTYLILGTY